MTPPSVPTGAHAIVITVTRIDISWIAAIDNIGVTGYKLYRDGSLFRSVTGTSTSDTGRTPGILYCYAVAAYDAAMNESARGNPTCAATSNQPPVAAFTGPASVLSGMDVTFDASASADSDGAIATYAFLFGDGSPLVTQSSPIAKHTFAASGTYVVSLTVTDTFGAKASTTGEITIGLVLSQPVNISNNPALSQTAFFTDDEAGAINVVWQERGADLVFSRSVDGGNSFAAPKYVVAPGDPLGSENAYSAGQMQVASTTDAAIHVAWTVFDLITGGSEIFYARSTDGGTTFSAPLLISTNDGVNSYVPSVAADGASTIGIAWGDFNIDNAVTYRRSIDGGDTFSAPVVIADSGLCPSVALRGQDVYVAWTAGLFGLEQILFSRSTDGGATFSPPSIVDHYPDKSWCPRLRMDPVGMLYLVWDEGPAFATNVLFSRSVDAGVSFSSPTNIVLDAGCSSITPGVAGRVYLSWAAGGRSFLASSADGGATFSVPLKIPNLGEDAGCVQAIAGLLNEFAIGWFAVPAGQSNADIFYAKGEVAVP